jgi:hypothetical protein
MVPQSYYFVSGFVSCGGAVKFQRAWRVAASRMASPVPCFVFKATEAVSLSCKEPQEISVQE